MFLLDVFYSYSPSITVKTKENTKQKKLRYKTTQHKKNKKQDKTKQERQDKDKNKTRQNKKQNDKTKQ